jgi:hypothetical protein
MAVSASGTPEAAVVGAHQSLWYYTVVKGKWHASRLGGGGTAYSGPSVVSGPGSNAAVAVEGKNHSLLLFVTSHGKWVRLTVAGRGSAYSAPSLAPGPSGVGIAVDGKSNSLWYYYLRNGHFHSKEIFSAGYAYSAPALVIRNSAQAVRGGPLGEVDIAVQASGHALYYVHSPAHGNSWQNTLVAGPGTTYAAPSLVVFNGSGAAFIAIEGPSHSLTVFSNGRGWSPGRVLLSSGWVYSAPSVVQNPTNPNLPVAIAYRGSSESIGVVLFNAKASPHPAWQNDPISATVLNGFSAPAMVVQPAGPAAQFDLIFQGANNTLWFYKGPKPPAGLAPNFTGIRIGKPGSTFGG